VATSCRLLKDAAGKSDFCSFSLFTSGFFSNLLTDWAASARKASPAGVREKTGLGQRGACLSAQG
jgi:hypothetical protein